MARDLYGNWYDGKPCFTPADERKCVNCLFWNGRMPDGDLKKTMSGKHQCNCPMKPWKAPRDTSAAHSCGLWEMIQEQPPRNETVRILEN